MVHKLTLQCKITARENGQRLLDLLTKRFTYHDIELWRQKVEAGQVLLNGETVMTDQLVISGDNLTYHAVNHQEPAVPTEIEIILETPKLLLVGKPAGTPVSRTGLIVYNTFVNILRRQYNQDIHLLHRLDRETSGLLLCARSKKSCGLYQKELSKIITGKYYLAVITGRLNQPVVAIEQPLATRDDSPVRCRMWPAENGKSCRTIFHKIARTDNYSLVLAELFSGRKHQIRAHLAHLGQPLVGDKIYSHGGKYYLKRIGGELTEEDYLKLGARNHTLHAWAVRLKLPDQPESMYYSQLFSDDMQKSLAYFPNWEKKAKTLLQSLTTTADSFK
ncbi:MAG: RluA family pseudouridine synthase [Thermodesulfobacteriota bacterium]